MPTPRSTSVESDGMVNVELHRAASMSESNCPVEFTKEQKEAQPAKKEDVFSYISSKATYFFSEIRQLNVEVVMFLYMFSYMLRSVSSTTMIMDKVCLFHLNKSLEICTHLSEHEDIKTEVESIANNYALAHSMIQMIPSSILACFIGAWSDKYSRKIPIIAALLGIIIDGLGSSICAGVFHSRVEYYLIPAIFTGFSGGFIGVLTVLYSYASDITNFSKRTMKYAIMEVAFGLSMPLGILTGGFISRIGSPASGTGYATIFLISTAGHIFGLAWVLFFLKETKGLDNNDSWKVKFRNLWSTQPVIESYKATVKLRPNRGREQILFLILAMGIVVLAFASTAGISYLYTHHMYNWDNATYSTVSSLFSITGTICMFITVPIVKKMGFDDPTLGIVGTASLVGKYIALGLAMKKESISCPPNRAIRWFQSLNTISPRANFIGLLGSLATLAGRSRISKVASKNDIGKVFAFLTSAESILPLASTAAVSQIFNKTLKTYAGTVYLIIGGLLVISLAVYIWLARLPAANYEEMYNNPETNEEPEEEKPKEKKAIEAIGEKNGV
ncbi:MFS domain-containing protein [Caerostris extrusa]|uniref:MFS domain-containing protein n=1 Tax=Caerostris extrusa TaxID=172846 RepID=A0AAV4U7K3_CAEEX|nr:MFS domain-containing protein [Caerostris extrusa]